MIISAMYLYGITTGTWEFELANGFFCFIMDIAIAGARANNLRQTNNQNR